MKIAVVILNWNGKSLLERFLPSVVKYSENADIYVADNASTDNSVSWLQEYYPEIKIVQNNENGGYAKGYNQALKNIKADIFCLLNSDVEVTKNWLVPIAEIFENQKDIACIQPKILWKKKPSYFEYAGAGGGFIDRLGYPYCRGRIFDTLEEDHQQYDDNQLIFWASGACLFIRSEDFWAENGFDEDFFAHQEEIDLCWRIQRRERKICFCHNSVVYHLGGATLSASNPKKTFLNFRNNLLMLAKNLPKNQLFIIIFSRLCLDGIAGIKFLLSGQFAHTWAIIKAHFSFYAHLPKFLKKRNGKYPKKYYHTQSIVWKYFIKKKKYFTDL